MQIGTQCAVITYDEIALKGGNRRWFENTLRDNIARKLCTIDSAMRCERWWGRMIVHGVTERTADAVRSVLRMTPGIVGYGLGVMIPREEETKETEIIHHVVAASRGTWKTFRVTVKRVDKNFPGTSQELARRYGAAVVADRTARGESASVALRGAEREIVVEILRSWVLVYIKERGVGGLPVGTSGHAVALLSGGFDSPVAAWMIATRGVEISAIHFHGMPHTSEASVQKVRDLSQVLAQYTGSVRLAIVPVVPAMKAIALEGKQDALRVVLLRRFMNRVAEAYAETVGARALVTGESVGQVASQTLENMTVTGAPVTMPLLRPLCGMSKQEIIARAQHIGTHDISVRPHDDTCSNFMPGSPVLRATAEEVEAALRTYDEDALVERALREVTAQTYSYRLSY